jgi:hypothetical protein
MANAFLIPMDRIIVFDPKSKILYGNAELHFTQNGPDIQITIGGRLGSSPGNPHKSRKRKLSAWNKYVKANSNKPRFRYRNGKLNLKKMAVAFRKTPAGRKKRR